MSETRVENMQIAYRLFLLERGISEMAIAVAIRDMSVIEDFIAILEENHYEFVLNPLFNEIQNMQNFLDFIDNYDTEGMTD